MNLITFKRWGGVKDEKFWYYGNSLKNPIFNEGVTKNQYIGGDCLKREEGMPNAHYDVLSEHKS